MKKLILVLAIALIASPSLGALSVTLSRIGTSNAVDVNYSGADPNNLPRAFALSLTFNSGATFTAVTSYKTGESTSASKGYGVYPAVIDINSAGVVQSWGSPQAQVGDPGAGAALPASNIVLEFASLYSGAGNAPATSGKLCSLTVNATGSNPVITMTDEITYRGGVVLENGTQDLTAADKSFTFTTATPPGKATVPSPANGATGVARIGTSLTWTAGSGATSHDVYFGTALPGSPTSPAQVGTSYAIPGTMKQSKVYYWRIDEKNAVGTTTGDVWSFTVQECLKSSDAAYGYWKLVGRPDCFCFKRQCKGDGNGAMTASKPVIANDFANFQAGYNLKYTQMINKVDLNGIPIICGDYTHSAAASKPVIAGDLTIFQANYNLKYTSITECASTNVNFWMN